MHSRYGDKHLSENFSPLIRFLRRNVGRPWAVVHSEMAKVLTHEELSPVPGL